MNLLEPQSGDDFTDIQESPVALDQLGEWRKTADCNSLRAGDVGGEAVLMGWVQRRRDHGGLIFVDLRDREGITQVVFDPQISRRGARTRRPPPERVRHCGEGKDALSP